MKLQNKNKGGLQSLKSPFASKNMFESNSPVISPPSSGYRQIENSIEEQEDDKFAQTYGQMSKGGKDTKNNTFYTEGA